MPLERVGQQEEEMINAQQVTGADEWILVRRLALNLSYSRLLRS